MTRLFTLILAISALTLFSCTNQSGDSASEEQQEETTTQEGLAGGWAPAEIQSEEVRAAVRVAYKSLNTPVEIKQITDAKQQVVKGMNYEVTFELMNGEKWKAIVYRDLSGLYSVTDVPERQ